MTKRQRHTAIKRHLAGTWGRLEKPISGRRRLDVRRKGVAIEVERSGQSRRLRLAVRRLATQKNAKKKLKVPQPHMNKAVVAAREVGVTLTVENLSGTRHRKVNC